MNLKFYPFLLDSNIIIIIRFKKKRVGKSPQKNLNAPDTEKYTYYAYRYNINLNLNCPSIW